MRVLVVEDDPEQRRVFALVIKARGHEVVECGTVAEARGAGPCELSFVDKNLPDGDGLELARELDGKVYLLSRDGVCTVIEAGSAGKVLATNSLEGTFLSGCVLTARAAAEAIG